MLAKLLQTRDPLSENACAKASHIMFVLPQTPPADAPAMDVLQARLKRRKAKYDSLGKSPLAADLPGGGVAVWVVLGEGLSAFERHERLRRAVTKLLDEAPRTLTIAVLGDESERQRAARDALYVSWLNSAELPQRKQKDARRRLEKIALFGWQEADGFADIAAQAEGNTLTRSLTMLPPNELTPAASARIFSR